MDILEYQKQRERMCSYFNNGCVVCPLRSSNSPDCFLIDKIDEEKIKIIEAWAKEHPIKTVKDKFFEVFGINLECSEEHKGYLYTDTINAIDLKNWLNSEYVEPTISETESVKRQAAKGLWRTVSGETMRIEDMTISHIKNSIMMLKRHNNSIYQPLIDVLQSELDRRL